MKTRKTFSAAAIVAVMACSAAHAQVLGGNVGGGLNGTLGGGLHDTSVLSNGNAAGSFGGELDTGSTTRSTLGRARGVADQTTHRARNVGENVRNRTESTVARARDTSENTVARARDTSTSAATSAVAAAETAKSEHVDAKKDLAPNLDGVTTDVSGSASGDASASRQGVVAEAAADANAVTSMDAQKNETPPTASQPVPPRDPSKL